MRSVTMAVAAYRVACGRKACMAKLDQYGCSTGSFHVLPAPPLLQSVRLLRFVHATPLSALLGYCLGALTVAVLALLLFPQLKTNSLVSGYCPGSPGVQTWPYRGGVCRGSEAPCMPVGSSRWVQPAPGRPAHRCSPPTRTACHLTHSASYYGPPIAP